MTMLDFKTVSALTCITVLSYFLQHLLLRRRPPLPPGPSFISLIDQAFRASSATEDKTFSKWANKYGDIVHISILNRHVIIINSAQVAADMLEYKGSIYSHRELTTMVKLVGWGDVMPFMQPEESFRKQRAYMRRLFGTQAALNEQSGIIEEESRRFLQHVLSSPEDLANFIRHFAGSIVLKIAYGYTTEEQDDPFIFRAERSIQELSLAGAPDKLPWMVDLFPSLQKLPIWFPGMRSMKLAKQWADNFREFTNAPFQLVKEQVAAGTAISSFTSTILADGDISPEDEHIIKLTSIGIYAGGSDTTVSTLRSFFLAMALNPDAFRKAQEEIDATVGTQRLPLISDRTRLPYLNALMLELLRWNPVAPNGLPHKSSQDDVHAGYFIPKGTIVLPNVHFMMNDPRLYKNPKQFMPERFLGENPEKDPREMTFGFGRRQCTGRLLAEDTMFTAFAMSIAVFNIRKKVKDGVEVEPLHRMTPGFISHPEPYEIDIKPRSAQAVALIQAESATQN